jgi:hypothetical protein
VKVKESGKGKFGGNLGRKIQEKERVFDDTERHATFLRSDSCLFVICGYIRDDRELLAVAADTGVRNAGYPDKIIRPGC